MFLPLPSFSGTGPGTNQNFLHEDSSAILRNFVSDVVQLMRMNIRLTGSGYKVASWQRHHRDVSITMQYQEYQGLGVWSLAVLRINCFLTQSTSRNNPNLSSSAIDAMAHLYGAKAMPIRNSLAGSS